MGVDKIKELTEYLSTRTILGEYVGHPDHQHLVRYDNVGLVFFMTVENTSGITCMLPEETLEFVKKFNLQTVRREELGNFSNFDDLADSLISVYEKVGSAPIFEEEEGSVL